MAKQGLTNAISYRFCPILVEGVPAPASAASANEVFLNRSANFMPERAREDLQWRIHTASYPQPRKKTGNYAHGQSCLLRLIAASLPLPLFVCSTTMAVQAEKQEKPHRGLLPSCNFSRKMPVKRGLFNPPATADLNRRNLPALHEIVEARERKAQVIGCLFYSKQMVIWRFAHSLRRCAQKQRGNNAIRRRFVTRIRDVIGYCQPQERLHIRVVWLMSQRIPEED
jgi:hypothetical protein